MYDNLSKTDSAESLPLLQAQGRSRRGTKQHDQGLGTMSPYLEFLSVTELHIKWQYLGLAKQGYSIVQ